MTDNMRVENKLLWWVIGILAAIVITGGAGAFGYTQAQIGNTNTVVGKELDTNSLQNERIRAIEVQYPDIIRRLDRIEKGVDRLNDKEN